eukprot:5111244-Prorocentrum_lima.AAC.1
MSISIRRSAHAKFTPPLGRDVRGGPARAAKAPPGTATRLEPEGAFPKRSLPHAPARTPPNPSPCLL